MGDGREQRDGTWVYGRHREHGTWLESLASKNWHEQGNGLEATYDYGKATTLLPLLGLFFTFTHLRHQ